MSEELVRRYFAVVADLASSAADLEELLHPGVRITEHPNAITPSGAVRDRDATVAGFLAGKRLLSAQAFDVHEVLGSGDRFAVRATWRGTIAQGGRELAAHIAAWVTIENGRIRAHETFDCYEP